MSRIEEKSKYARKPLPSAALPSFPHSFQIFLGEKSSKKLKRELASFGGKGVEGMEVYRHIIPWMESLKKDVCLLENDPVLWSEDMITKTYRKSGAVDFSIHDAQTFIKDYLKVLCENA